MKNAKNTKVRKTRKIASAFAALSMMSAMAMPLTTISANAAETSLIEEFAPDTDTTVYNETDEDIAILHEISENLNNEVTTADQQDDEEAPVTTATEAEESTETSTTAAEAVIEETTVPAVSEDETEKIKDYISGLKYEECIKSADFSDGSNGKATFKIDDKGNVRITRKHRVDANGMSDTLAIADNNSKIYPGALVIADEGLTEGNPKFINLKRNDTSIFISNGSVKSGENRSISVNPKNASDVQNAMRRLEERIDVENGSQAIIKCDVTAISSSNQLKAKASASQKLYGDLKVDVDAASKDEKQIALVDFTQVYYTMAANNQILDEPFAKDETFKDISRQIHEDTPAAMITSVDYGRRIVACVETSDMSFDLSASLKASGMNDKLQADASTEIHNKLKSCSVQFYIYGGTAGNAKKIITCEGVDKLLECINNETVYAANSALPIAYTASFIKDGSTAYTKSTGEYYTSTVEVKKPTPLTLEATGINGRVYSGSIKLTGKRIVGVTDSGTPILSEEEVVIADEKFTSNAKSSAYTEIPADIDLASVRVYFDYEGQNKSGFGNDNGIRLSTYIQDGVDLTKLSLAHIHIEGTGQLFWYKVNGWVNLIYNGKCYHKGIQDK